MSGDRSSDLLGLRPYGETLRVLAQGGVDGAGAFLGRICLPAAEEFGLYLKDRVSAWRKGHAVGIVQKAEVLIGPGAEGFQAHPRLVMRIIDEGSWSDDDAVQGMWAGLLATSCDAGGRDESNLIFVNLLGQMTTCQARVFRFACEHANVRLTPGGLLFAEEQVWPREEIVRVSGVSDLHRLDREIDHLRDIGVLYASAGFSPGPDKVTRTTPSTLGLQLYVRCQGFRGSPEAFFKLDSVPQSGS